MGPRGLGLDFQSGLGLQWGSGAITIPQGVGWGVGEGYCGEVEPSASRGELGLGLWCSITVRVTLVELSVLRVLGLRLRSFECEVSMKLMLITRC